MSFFKQKFKYFKRLKAFCIQPVDKLIRQGCKVVRSEYECALVLYGFSNLRTEKYFFIYLHPHDVTDFNFQSHHITQYTQWGVIQKSVFLQNVP